MDKFLEIFINKHKNELADNIGYAKRQVDEWEDDLVNIDKFVSLVNSGNHYFMLNKVTKEMKDWADNEGIEPISFVYQEGHLGDGDIVIVTFENNDIAMKFKLSWSDHLL